MRKTIEKIAKKHLWIDTLDIRGLDSLDFHEVAVWSIEKALTEAYREGQRSVTGDKGGLYDED